MSEENKVRIIEVVSHNPKWKEEFISEAKKIECIMGNEIVKIHHIGSTSIPGIYAKPVIDILIEVKNIENIDKYNNEMSKLGYVAKGEFGIDGRRFFLKGVYDRTHHIHVFESGSTEIDRHLNFRDYMIAHPNEAKAYEELKKELATKYRYDNEAYCDGKNAFIKEMDKRADHLAKTR